MLGFNQAAIDFDDANRSNILSTESTWDYEMEQKQIVFTLINREKYTFTFPFSEIVKPFYE